MPKKKALGAVGSLERLKSLPDVILDASWEGRKRFPRFNSKEEER